MSCEWHVPKDIINSLFYNVHKSGSQAIFVKIRSGKIFYINTPSLSLFTSLSLTRGKETLNIFDKIWGNFHRVSANKSKGMRMLSLLCQNDNTQIDWRDRKTKLQKLMRAVTATYFRWEVNPIPLSIRQIIAKCPITYSHFIFWTLYI